MSIQPSGSPLENTLIPVLIISLPIYCSQLNTVSILFVFNSFSIYKRLLLMKELWHCDKFLTMQNSWQKIYTFEDLYMIWSTIDIVPHFMLSYFATSLSLGSIFLLIPYSYILIHNSSSSTQSAIFNAQYKVTSLSDCS